MGTLEGWLHTHTHAYKHMCVYTHTHAHAHAHRSSVMHAVCSPSPPSRDLCSALLASDLQVGSPVFSPPDLPHSAAPPSYTLTALPSPFELSFQQCCLKSCFDRHPPHLTWRVSPGENILSPKPCTDDGLYPFLVRGLGKRRNLLGPPFPHL